MEALNCHAQEWEQMKLRTRNTVEALAWTGQRHLCLLKQRLTPTERKDQYGMARQSHKSSPHAFSRILTYVSISNPTPTTCVKVWSKEANFVPRHQWGDLMCCSWTEIGFKSCYLVVASLSVVRYDTYLSIFHRTCI